MVELPVRKFYNRSELEFKIHRALEVVQIGFEIISTFSFSGSTAFFSIPVAEILLSQPDLLQGFGLRRTVMTHWRYGLI